MLGPFATASRRIAIHQVSSTVARRLRIDVHNNNTTRDRGDRYGPMEWPNKHICSYTM